MNRINTSLERRHLLKYTRTYSVVACLAALHWRQAPNPPGQGTLPLFSKHHPQVPRRDQRQPEQAPPNHHRGHLDIDNADDRRPTLPSRPDTSKRPPSPAKPGGNAEATTPPVDHVGGACCRHHHHHCPPHLGGCYARSARLDDSLAPAGAQVKPGPLRNHTAHTPHPDIHIHIQQPCRAYHVCHTTCSAHPLCPLPARADKSPAAAASVDLDECIARLYKKELLAESVIEAICAKTKELLMRESNVVHVAAPITVVGDIHGQFYDLIEIFRIGGYCPDTNYLFLGRPSCPTSLSL